MAEGSQVRLVIWDDMEREELAEGIGRRFVSGQTMTVARIDLGKGAMVPSHHHHNEQICTVVAGRLEFRLGEGLEDKRIVGAGQSLVIPPDLAHEVIALEDSTAYDLFSPPRQDWIDGTDSYFQAPRGSDPE